MSGTYACVLVANRRVVSLFEVSATAEERTVCVTSGPGIRSNIELPIWYYPSVAMLPEGGVAVWAVGRLFLLRPGRNPFRADFDDELRAVYPVGGNLCIVGELGVCICDADQLTIIDRFEASDVLGGSWWERDTLFVESAAGPPLAFKPSASAVGYLAAYQPPG